MDSDITLSPTSIACSEWSVSRDYYKRLREVSKVPKVLQNSTWQLYTETIVASF